MNITVAILVAVLAAGISYATLNISVCNAIKVLRPADPDVVYDSIPLNKTVIWLMIVCIAVAGFIVAEGVLRRTTDVLGICRMLIALLCMVGSACVDFREKRIPNFFPVTMALSGLGLLLAGIVLKQDNAVAYITGNFIACALCVLFLVVASAITKQGIGAGDIKLIGALAILSGIYTVMGTIFYGVLACGAVAILALISRKMSMSNSLPFGPFLFLGFIATVLTGNF